MAVGDALGLPWEFKGKGVVRASWDGSMVGYGTWGMPPGTWSDDTGQALALADALARHGLSLEAFGRSLLAWLRGEYMPDGAVFDIGVTTSKALMALAEGVPPTRSGVNSPSCGSLMRAYPLATYTACLPLDEALEAAHRFSAVTHAHPLAEMACGLYTAAVRALLAGLNPRDAVDAATHVLGSRYARSPRYGPWVREFNYLLKGVEGLEKEPEEGSCYAPETLYGALWSLTHSRSFREALEKAVGLGGDTDTLGAVAGSLAGTHYGEDSIPREWVGSLRRRDLLEEVLERFVNAVERACSGE